MCWRASLTEVKTVRLNRASERAEYQYFNIENHCFEYLAKILSIFFAQRCWNSWISALARLRWYSARGSVLLYLIYFIAVLLYLLIVLYVLLEFLRRATAFENKHDTYLLTYLLQRCVYNFVFLKAWYLSETHERGDDGGDTLLSLFGAIADPSLLTNSQRTTSPPFTLCTALLTTSNCRQQFTYPKGWLIWQARTHTCTRVTCSPSSHD